MEDIFINQVDSKGFSNDPVDIQWDHFDQRQNIDFLYKKQILMRELHFMASRSSKCFCLAKHFLSRKMEAFYEITLQGFYNVKNF